MDNLERALSASGEEKQCLKLCGTDVEIVTDCTGKILWLQLIQQMVSMRTCIKQSGLIQMRKPTRSERSYKKVIFLNGRLLRPAMVMVGA